jgi:type I restriction enzyme S subunit
VLTAGQSFILGYTDEEDNIFSESLPVIIFDDFTTAIKYVDFPFKVKSSAMKILKAGKNADVKFLYYFMTRIKVDTELHKRYWISMYSNIQIPLPPLSIQQKIADVLDRASTLIEQRRDQIAKLDLLVKSRFVEMFGDPARNPMGWEGSTIGDSCYHVKDGPHVSPKYVDDETGIPFISTRNLVAGNGIDWSTAKFISDSDYVEYSNKCKPEKGDVLYTKGGTTGIARYVDTDIRFANWVHVAVLKFGENLNGVFFEYMLNSNYCYQQSQLLTKGIANRDLVLGAMKQIKFYLPPLELQNRFADFVRAVEKSRAGLQLGLDGLELLYKSLIQKCFKGEMY